MARNMAEPGMENFNYEGVNPNYMISKPKGKNLSSGGTNSNNVYAPGSPKPMKDTQEHYEKNYKVAEFGGLRQQFSGMSHPYSEGEKMIDEDGIFMTQQWKLPRDSVHTHVHIMGLTGHSSRFHELEATLAKRNQTLSDELNSTKEQLSVLSTSKERLLMDNQRLTDQVLCSERNFRLNAEDNERLRIENNNLKRTVDSLSSELSSFRESLSSSDHSRAFTANNSLASTQDCSKELESLHHVVDSLKATVLQQRNFLLKLKASDSSSSMVSEAHGPAKTATSQSMPALASKSRLSHRFRQGEEGTGPSLQDPTDPSKLLYVGGQYMKNASLTASNGLDASFAMGMGSKQNGLEHASRNQDVVFQLAGFGISSETLDDAERVKNAYFPPHNDIDLMCLNSVDLVPKGNVACASPKREQSPPVQQIVNEASGQDLPKRKISHSEKLYTRPPSQNVSTHSKTETLAYNPRIRAQLQPETNPHKPRLPPAVSFLQQEAMQSRVRQPATWPPTVTPPVVTSSSISHKPTSASQLPAHHVVQSSQYYLSHGWPKPPCMLTTNPTSQAVSDTGAKQRAMPATPTLDIPVNPRRGGDDQSFQFSSSPRDRLDSDRLCPVCNRDFGSVSIEQFQSHVLECFDNDSGPETMVAEDFRPQRLCPMCNTSFGDGMSQDEFEKHVNGHFPEEDPGENFEVLGS